MHMMPPAKLIAEEEHNYQDQHEQQENHEQRREEEEENQYHQRLHKSRHQPRTKLLLTKNLFTIETIAYLALVILTICSFCQGSPCQSGNWWDPVLDKCIKCTDCEGPLIVLRPCQIHQDTICGTIHDLHIDWAPLARTEPNWKERRKEKELQRRKDSENTEMVWDWQAASLVLAAVACLIFFLAAAYISIQHMRQWRRMERRLDRDVEELSAKLMAKLAEVQHVENGGSFLIENPIKDQNARPVEVHCVYLEKLLAGKEAQKTPQSRGNFYIEGNGSKG